ncbi:DUF4349 domain-containing protein [Microbacterium sp. SLBN-146]|uniref:DUF4349 domain-containing protein n=1 Tax=Microbacterium sp. SLBN-146 TaxID=2768457 RepID=UPI001154ABC7|nr:DUF4349 domain-containing protein [Microbacterium sp. SLBN-146]TQJ31896.1 uncharacterized protein DUF4349 [Microbacterium sp. SLBN-146]
MNTTEKYASLPELDDARIDDIEDSLFARIADDRAARQRRSARRGRAWMAGGAAAAVIAVAAIIAPSVGGLVGGSSGADSSAVQPASDGGFAVLPENGVIDGTTLDGARSTSGGAVEESSGAGDMTATDREIITTASASITVQNVRESAGAIGDAAVDRGGYVESMSIGTSGVVAPVDPQTGLSYDSLAYPPTDGGWISVRVPSGELAALVADLSEFGEVTASSIDRQDVTEQTVDLDARIEAAQASVDRLTDLMAQAGDLSDLIAAEAALSERQANLESLEQQREMIADQVAMSTLSVSLSPVVETVQADPAGFSDGLVAGWNGLVATLNGIVVALGFLLPWLGVATIAGLIVWGIVRVTRRRRARRADAVTPED